jgi:hypothetical protein
MLCSQQQSLQTHQQLLSITINSMHSSKEPNRACCVQAASANRPSWFPGSKFPDHLDGTLVGDHGFDPLGLGKDPAKLKW